jgi:hypothetical protein
MRKTVQPVGPRQLGSLDQSFPQNQRPSFVFVDRVGSLSESVARREIASGGRLADVRPSTTRLPKRRADCSTDAMHDQSGEHDFGASSDIDGHPELKHQRNMFRVVDVWRS